MRPIEHTVALLTIGFAASGLSACSQPAPPAPTISPAQAADSTAAPVAIEAPAGRYDLDPDHSSLRFKVNHLGASNYIARFTSFKVTIDLDPENLGASSVVATVDPTSIGVDYFSDYQALHPQSKFQSWREDLAQSGLFFNAGQYPQIAYRSTRVEQTGPGAVRIVGDLTLLGKTHPITLDATLVGSRAVHPLYGGGGVIGFSAQGSFERSSFGMNHLLQPLLVGDNVTVMFEGEFRQAVTSPGAAVPAN